MSASQKRQTSVRRWLQWIGTVLSSVLFVWLLTKLDWTQTIAGVRRIPVWVILAAMMLFFSGQIANSIRWYLLLRAQEVTISLVQTFKIVLAGAFASNFLPTTIGGDTVRIFVLLKQKQSQSVSVGSVMVDRFLNVLAWLTVMPVAFMVFGPTVLSLGQGAASGSAFVLVGSISPNFSAITKRVQKASGAFWATLKIWLKNPLVLIEGFVISWLSILVIFLGIWFIATGIGIQVALYQVMAVSAITYLVTILPISFNGYGLREVTVTALYMQLGASLEQASTLAILTRFLRLIETLPGAAWLSTIIVDTDETDLKPREDILEA